jgi:hypothetical protein
VTRSRPAALAAAAAALLLALAGPVGAEPGEWSGEFALETRLFPADALHAGQVRHNASLAAEPEYWRPFGPHSVTVRPFARIDSADAERTHADLREGFASLVFDRAELELGVRKVFWGVTEVRHVVDVVNPTDAVEHPDTEDKLGQPMAHLIVPKDWGQFEAFLMPWFRERTFPGRRGRLRGPLVVDTNQAFYESAQGRHHPDWALRYKRFFGPWEVGLSHFRGTGREPTLVPGTDGGGNPVLVPYYEIVGQSGVDAQWIVGEWLLKFEGVRRTGQGAPFYAWDTGFEYTFVAVAGTRMDLGVLGEWLRDTRGAAATTPFDHDLAAGLRLTVNDLSSTECLLATVADPATGGWSAYLEGSRRVAERVTLEVEARLFGGMPADDLLYGSRRDDHLQLTLAYHY